MNLLIGCPVKDRAWILPSWFQHVEVACEEIDVHPSFVFNYGTSSDNTRDILQRVTSSTVLYTPETLDYLPHVWNDMDRYAQMSSLRNQLLEYARLREVDYYLSLDSDVLIAPGVLPNLFETIESCDAVGGKMYMDHRGRFNPSYAIINRVNGGLQREDSEGVFRVDVIMAMKLMKPSAYNVNYVEHFQGEDVGWGLNCRFERLSLKWDGRIASKHVIIPPMLTRIDERVGF